MSQSAAIMIKMFDLAALDALLGAQGFLSVLESDAPTGLVRCAAVNRECLEGGSLVRFRASYVLGLAGHGRRLYPLLTVDFRVSDGVAYVLCARRLGRRANAMRLVEALITFTTLLAQGRLPERAQLAAFLPPQMLDALENDLYTTDFPDQGIDREEALPESLWDRPCVLYGNRMDSDALAVMLNLAVGEQAQRVDIDPLTGDYRVFHLGVAATLAGGEVLTFELHRQMPGFERRIFSVLTLALGCCDAEGLCLVESFSCDAGISLNDLPPMLPQLAGIIASLQARKRPHDDFILPFLSKAAQVLWTQKLPERMAS